MKYLSNILVSIDQLGNALAGGNPDNTISSRIGYYTRSMQDSKIAFHWKLFRNIIDFTFYPIDGENHCEEAYYNDSGETFDKGTKDIVVVMLAIIIIPSCLFIGIILYSLLFLGVVSPKKINRNKNIKKRLEGTKARLNGILIELNSDKVEIDNELKEILEQTQKKLSTLSQKINGMLDLNRRLEKYKAKAKKSSQSKLK